MKKLLLLLCFVPMLMATTCEDDDDNLKSPCTDGLVYGLNVTVKDAATGAVLTDGVEVVAADGASEENLELLTSATVFSGAPENPGSYVITVTKAGYQTYVTQPVVVTSDACHVIPKNITIELLLQ
jgi:hypothetical protein